MAATKKESIIPEKASEYQKIKQILTSPKANEKKVVRDGIKGKQNFATNKLK